MPTTRFSLAVAAATLAAVGTASVTASAARTPSAKAVEHAKVVPGKPYSAGDGRKN